jgi:hypothetical protein
MATLRPAIRRRLAGLFVVPALLVGGCSDEDPNIPVNTGALDGGGLFASSLVATMFYQSLNEITERALEMIDGNGPFLTTEPACSGSGIMVISLDQALTTATVSFDNYVVGCTDPMRLTLNGSSALVLEFQETSPGLRYTARMSFNHCTGGAIPEGVTMQLPQDADNLILVASTPGDQRFVNCDPSDPGFDPYGPGGALTFELDGTRAAGGTIHVDGTVRIEDDSGFLLVNEVALEWDYAPTRDPVISEWPSGSMEVASFGAPGGGPVIGGAVAGYPVDVVFDGFGGATFQYEDRTCETNLITGDNPCESL